MPELIDRQVACGRIEDLICGKCASSEESDCENCSGRVLVEEVEKIPTIEAEPVRHGRWIPTEYDSYADGAPVWDKWECSECGHEHKGEEDTLTDYCPQCGARMDATEEGGEPE